MVLSNSGITNKNIKTKIGLCRTQITSHKGTVGISHEVKIFLCSLRWSAQGEGDSSFVNLSTPVPQFNKMSPQSNILLPKVLSSKNKGWFRKHQQNLNACYTIRVDGSVRKLVLFWFGVKLVFLRVWQIGSRRHGRVGGLHLAEAWPGAGWPVPYLVRGPCGGNWAQGGRPPVEAAPRTSHRPRSPRWTRSCIPDRKK